MFPGLDVSWFKHFCRLLSMYKLHMYQYKMELGKIHLNLVQEVIFCKKKKNVTFDWPYLQNGLCKCISGKRKLASTDKNMHHMSYILKEHAWLCLPVSEIYFMRHTFNMCIRIITDSHYTTIMHLRFMIFAKPREYGIVKCVRNCI